MMISTMPMISTFGGVYCITNRKNGKKLIGVTSDFALNHKNTLRLLRQGKFGNEKLQKEFNEGYRFSYKAICSVSETEYFKEKRKYLDLAKTLILKYDTVNNGYNVPHGLCRKSKKEAPDASPSEARE